MAVEPLTWTRVFTAWTFAPLSMVIILGAGAVYLASVHQVRRDGEWPVGRTAWFLSGLVLWAVCVCSFIGVYERVLFTARAAQVTLLLTVVPLLLALGAPVTLLAEALPPRRRERLRAALRGRLSRALMFPLVSTVMLIAPPWLLYFTPWYELTLRSGVFNALLPVELVIFGSLYFWPRLQLDPVAREYPHLVGFGITFSEVIFDGALGLLLIFGHRLIAASYYAGLHRTWGPSLRQDQVWGGGTLWVLGDIAGLPFLAALGVRMFRQDRRAQIEVDRRLDEEAAARRAARPADAPDPGPEMMRPWWETDPILSKRYGRGDQG
ncbi:cytochrome c oxidase assembly protein [Actinoallomurus sp. NPDC052274]|uniref:cytochrome c oxidase assembly protein n=1 Tax=Actinoallomurus sp. NPDC052274 TaxID=3155420 RepID=UPI00344A2EB6